MEGACVVSPAFVWLVLQDRDLKSVLFVWWGRAGRGGGRGLTIKKNGDDMCGPGVERRQKEKNQFTCASARAVHPPPPLSLSLSRTRAHTPMADTALAALLARAALPAAGAVGLQLLLSPALADGAA